MEKSCKCTLRIHRSESINYDIAIARACEHIVGAFNSLRIFWKDKVPMMIMIVVCQSSTHASIQKPQKYFVTKTKTKMVVCSYFYAQLWPNVSIKHSSDCLLCHFFHLICLYARQIHLISKVNHFTEVIILFATLEKWLRNWITDELNEKTLAITKMLLPFK